ncbi:hypothetical protein GE061_004087 [Apolygus lucorum]|uniref:Uncharacterized protein n=1 Tax=Apolygus lucorum TaxID=248454 RepID=A0A8S9WY75_APOLU|nr:hypothetical protein GE061_004087 [Apolygus lucorum]
MTTILPPTLGNKGTPSVGYYEQKIHPFGVKARPFRTPPLPSKCVYSDVTEGAGSGMQYQTKRRRDLVVLLKLWRYHPARSLFMLLGLVLTLVFFVSTIKSFRYPTDSCDENYHYYVGFYGSRYPVPNIVHFYREGQEASSLTVSDVACIEAALRHQGSVYIHTDDPKAATQAAKTVGLESRVTILPAPVSTSVSIPLSILW